MNGVTSEKRRDPSFAHERDCQERKHACSE